MNTDMFTDENHDMLPAGKQVAGRPNYSLVSESEWLHDVMYAIQGVDGRYVKYWPLRQSFQITTTVPRSVSDVVLKISQMGVLYKRISTFIKHSSVKTESLLLQSLTARIQTELVEYYRFTAAVQKNLELAELQSTNAKQAPLTLRKLLVLSEPAMRKLRVLATVVDTVEECFSTCGQTSKSYSNSDSRIATRSLLSKLHYYSGHGDPAVNEFMSALLKDITAPFFAMLKAWIFEGKLADPYDEFFVSENKSADSRDVWRGMFSFTPTAAPSFIDQETARKAFVTGKSLKFLMICCGEENYLLSRGALADTAEGFEYGHFEALKRTIDRMYKETNRKVISILMNKFKLFVHISALKRIMLLEQGDLAQCLVEELCDTLSRPARQVYRHSISTALESAIRSSNTQFEEPGVLSRIDVRLLDSQAIDSANMIGWDIFALDYAIDSPIDTVLTPKIMQQYHVLSKFLWKVRRVEHSVISTWKQRNVILSRGLQNTKDQFPMLHSAAITLKSMQHFLSKLQFYLFYEVLECSFLKLKSFVDGGLGDLDLLIATHEAYLSEIMNNFFLSPSQSDVSNSLAQLLQEILVYVQVFEAFCDICIIKNHGTTAADFIVADGGTAIETTFTLSSGNTYSMFGSGGSNSSEDRLRDNWSLESICKPIRKIIDDRLTELYEQSRADMLRSLVSNTSEGALSCIDMLVDNQYALADVLTSETDNFNSMLVNFVDLPHIKKTSLFSL